MLTKFAPFWALGKCPELDGRAHIPEMISGDRCRGRDPESHKPLAADQSFRLDLQMPLFLGRGIMDNLSSMC